MGRCKERLAGVFKVWPPVLSSAVTCTLLFRLLQSVGPSYNVDLY